MQNKQGRYQILIRFQFENLSEETTWGPWRKWNWIIQDGVTDVD